MLLDLDTHITVAKAAEAVQFPLRVPRGFVARMRKGDPDDPLLRQVLPVDAEGLPSPGFVTDPLKELDAMPVPGLLHKYAGRVLVTLTGACGIHCRYCFRRHFPYSDANPAQGNWQQSLDYIRERKDVHEVLLSGGDPLSLSDKRLAVLVADLSDIPHLKRLRIHTRMPTVLPERVDASLLAWIEKTPLNVAMVVHINHAQEVDDNVRNALAQLRGKNVMLLNQAVLLNHVNNSIDQQVNLWETVFEAGVLPYYLHLLDPVKGAAHFNVPEVEARRLLAALQARLPGYLVPRLAREDSAATAKTWLGPLSEI